MRTLANLNALVQEGWRGSLGRGVREAVRMRMKRKEEGAREEQEQGSSVVVGASVGKAVAA